MRHQLREGRKAKMKSEGLFGRLSWLEGCKVIFCLHGEEFLQYIDINSRFCHAFTVDMFTEFQFTLLPHVVIPSCTTSSARYICTIITPINPFILPPPPSP